MSSLASWNSRSSCSNCRSLCKPIWSPTGTPLISVPSAKLPTDTWLRQVQQRPSLSWIHPKGLFQDHPYPKGLFQGHLCMTLAIMPLGLQRCMAWLLLAPQGCMTSPTIAASSPPRSPFCHPALLQAPGTSTGVLGQQPRSARPLALGRSLSRERPMPVAGELSCSRCQPFAPLQGL